MINGESGNREAADDRVRDQLVVFDQQDAHAGDSTAIASLTDESGHPKAAASLSIHTAAHHITVTDIGSCVSVFVPGVVT
jgi:hypothetical protein